MNQRNMWQLIVGTIVMVVVLGGAIYFFTMSKSQQPAPREAITLDASFDKMLEARLVPIKPGERLDIMLSSELDDGLQKQALRITSLDDGRGIAMFYDTETPGDYQLKLAYEYPGPKSPNCAHVFGEETNT